MGCFVLKKYFLQFLEGNVSNIKYIFACEHTSQISQNLVSFFLFDLNSINKDIDSINNPKTNLIAGLISDQCDGFAEKLKDYLKHCINENIYIKNNQYLDGFSNIIESSQDFLNSIDSSRGYSNYFPNNYKDSKEHTVINLAMITDGQIYLSKSVSKYNDYENKWCYKIKDKLNEVNLKDLKDMSYDQIQTFQLQVDKMNQINEIILTSKSCPNEFLNGDIRKKYPQPATNTKKRKIYLLKIKF